MDDSSVRKVYLYIYTGVNHLPSHCHSQDQFLDFWVSLDSSGPRASFDVWQQECYPWTSPGPRAVKTLGDWKDKDTGKNPHRACFWGLRPESYLNLQRFNYL